MTRPDLDERASPTGGDGALGDVPGDISSDDTLRRLAAILEQRKSADPAQSYVARLYSKGVDSILKKIGEEATETVMAAKDGVPERIVSETADLWFHCLVMLAHFGLTPDHVLAELRRREGLSGLEEKALRKLHEREAGGGV